jgi:hypothetical protein
MGISLKDLVSSFLPRKRAEKFVSIRGNYYNLVHKLYTSCIITLGSSEEQLIGHGDSQLLLGCSVIWGRSAEIATRASYSESSYRQKHRRLSHPVFRNLQDRHIINNSSSSDSFNSHHRHEFHFSTYRTRSTSYARQKESLECETPL